MHGAVRRGWEMRTENSGQAERGSWLLAAEMLIQEMSALAP